VGEPGAAPTRYDRGVSDIEAAWDDVRAANALGWRVGRPYYNDERRSWEQYAFDPTERSEGMRSREWIAVGPTEVGCVRSMAYCLRELGERRWPR